MSIGIIVNHSWGNTRESTSQSALQAQESLLHDESLHCPSPRHSDSQEMAHRVASTTHERDYNSRSSNLRHTTMNSRYSTNKTCVIDPSTTVLATIPSKDNKPSAEKRRPRMKMPFMTAQVPLRDRPRVLNAVRSSFETSSRNPNCLGKYWAI